MTPILSSGGFAPGGGNLTHCRALGTYTRHYYCLYIVHLDGFHALTLHGWHPSRRLYLRHPAYSGPGRVAGVEPSLFLRRVFVFPRK